MRARRASLARLGSRARARAPAALPPRPFAPFTTRLRPFARGRAGRIAQLAALGWIFPELAHFPGKESLGIDFSEVNPLEAIGSVPAQANWQIFAFATLLEGGRIRKIIEEGDDYVAGDLGLGQGLSNISPFGSGRFNPFGFQYTPEEFAEKQLQEIKHCRLAMLAVFFQYTKSAGMGPGEGVLGDFLSAFSAPAYVEKAGYFFPEGV